MVPTHVGVYQVLVSHLKNMEYGPHACGGVPVPSIILILLGSWSPRMWGCTVLIRNILNELNMVPTHVGVYRFLSIKNRIT